MLRQDRPTGFRPIAPEQYIDISQRVCAMQYETSAPPAPTAATLAGYQIGPVSLVHYQSRGLEHGQRTLEHIRATPLDGFILCMPLQARFEFVHAGRRSEVSSGSAVLLSTQQPFDAYVCGLDEDAMHSSLQLRIPGALLRGRAPQIDRLCNREFSMASGGGALLRTLLLASMQQAANMAPAQAGHYSHAVADLLAACVNEIRQPTVLPRAALAGDAIFDRACLFIDCQLSAANLNPGLVARHCRVSLRYLNKIFAQRSLSVAGYIRELRLQCCQRAFADPQLSGRSIIEIACRWGFSDPSHFGRLYRKRFGVSPSQQRAGGPVSPLN